MSTTLKLQDTMNWSRAYLKNQPQEINGMEPALTTGNIVLQTILGAPFKWRHTRGTYSFQTVPGSGPTPANPNAPTIPSQSDYPVAIPDFGFLEQQVAVIGGNKAFEVGNKFSLARPTGSPARPTLISAQLDDGLGNITFRINTNPDQPYVIEGEYQKKAPILKSPASILSGVPDDFAFVFNWGYLTVISMLVDDPRFPIWEKYFIGRLLGLQEGLDEVDRNIFLGLWETNTKTGLRAQGAVQQGQSGRGQ